MTETTHEDGELDRDFFFSEIRANLYAHAQRLHAKALADPTVIEIRQRFGIGKNKPCPCGSGLMFKVCCFRKAIRV